MPLSLCRVGSGAPLVRSEKREGLGMTRHVLAMLSIMSVLLAPWSMEALTAADCDFNGNGEVEVTDFLVFGGAYNTRKARFDLDRDGTVGMTDFLVFARFYGQASGVKTITGTARTADGSGLPHCRVAFSREDAHEVFVAIAGPNGEYRVVLPAGGRYTIHCFGYRHCGTRVRAR